MDGNYARKETEVQKAMKFQAIGNISDNWFIISWS